MKIDKNPKNVLISGLDFDVESGRGIGEKSPSPTIRVDPSPETVKCISNAKFDPRGKSVSSGKNITGWL